MTTPEVQVAIPEAGGTEESVHPCGTHPVTATSPEGPRSSPAAVWQTKGVPPPSRSGRRTPRRAAHPPSHPAEPPRSSPRPRTLPTGRHRPSGGRRPAPPRTTTPSMQRAAGSGARAPQPRPASPPPLPSRGGRHVPPRSANRGGAGRVTCLCLALLCAAGRAGAEWGGSGGAGRWVRAAPAAEGAWRWSVAAALGRGGDENGRWAAEGGS